MSNEGIWGEARQAAEKIPVSECVRLILAAMPRGRQMTHREVRAAVPGLDHATLHAIGQAFASLERCGEAVRLYKDSAWLVTLQPGVTEKPAVTTARIWSWDYNQQPDLEEMAEFITELSGGKVVLQEVETGSQEYAWTIAGRELSEEERARMLDEHNGG